MTAPLIAVDVDGVLNPFKATPTRRPEGYKTHRLSPFDGPRYRVWLHPDHGEQLMALARKTGGELVWLTMWEHEANRLIAPLIGLPELPVIEVPPRGGWKFDAAAEYARDRALVWFDDDFDLIPGDLTWFESERGDTPTLLHRVHPSIGLTEADMDLAAEWLEQVETAR